jgi:predicted Zn-dependent protease
MARAGYDPREAVAFWKRFQVYGDKRGGKPPEFLSTHPLDGRRIEAIERQLPKAVAEYERSRGGR